MPRHTSIRGNTLGFTGTEMPFFALSVPDFQLLFDWKLRICKIKISIWITRKFCSYIKPRQIFCHTWNLIIFLFNFNENVFFYVKNFVIPRLFCLICSHCFVFWQHCSWTRAKYCETTKYFRETKLLPSCAYIYTNMRTYIHICTNILYVWI